MDQLDVIPSLSNDGVLALVQLRTAFEGFSIDSKPWPVLATLLLDRTRMAADICNVDTVISRAKGIAIWQFMNFARSQPASSDLPINRLLERVRRLLRLGEDRDLRQLPAAAQCIDAVRLMTIHGSKGLEFDAVHLPGLNEDTLPGYWRGAPVCPPPEGMIQGGTGSTEAILKAARIEEQECLFYVAQSRARDHLFLYAVSSTKSGKSRKPSEDFLQRMGSGLHRKLVTTERVLPPAPSSVDILLSLNGRMRFDAHQIDLYESCPRRFFYTHLLQTGGRRRTTPFIQMHEAVRKVLKQVVAGSKTTTEFDLEINIAEALAAEGLSDHGYYDQYRDFALAMIRYFETSRLGHIPERPAALQIVHAEEEIFITPDDVLIAPDGTRILRKVMTGHGRKDVEKNVSAAAFLMAAVAAFPGARAELVFLADQQTRTIALKPKEIDTRKQHLNNHLIDIRAGRFPPNTSSRTCPNCPAFFICGPVPNGAFSPAFRPAPTC